MAIPIIGAPKAEAESSPLPIADVDLPPPGTAPAGHASLSEARVKELLAHPHPLVRAFAVEQVASRPGDSWSQALLPLIDDADPEVASDALRALEERKYQPAAEAIAARFLSGGGEVAARAASALGTLAPEKLLAALKHRGRLDDEAYGATAAALAVIGTPEVVDFLDKALNRSGALSPERRGSLYGAALLSGSGQLAHRVLSVALEDSKRQEPDGASFPSRSALAGVAGMPIPLSRRAEGLAVFDGVRETITQDLLPKLAEKDRPALEEAMGKKRVERLLDALRVVLELKIRDEHPDDYGSIPRRRRGLLAALLERKEEIGKLELDAAAIFAAAAVQAAMFIVSDGSDEGSSPALSGLAKALESPGIDGPKLAAMSGDELAALFKDKTERQMRRVVTILSREAVHHPSTLKRIAAAIVRAGHGMGLLEAAAEVEDPRVHQGVLIALSDAQADREQIVVDALTRTPVEPKLARLALLLAEEVRTERVALAIGRRFYDFRQLARTELIRAALRNGDPRLSPLLASRAFKDEPEEVAWALMMVAQGADGGEKLADALARAERAHRGDAPQRREVVVPLACKRCNEVLAYHFERVILDIESGDQLGDPAFVGDVRCRACGVEDQLEPTEEAGRILVAHMMEFIEASRRGQPTQSLLVTPGQTDVHGKRVGLAKALRMTSEEIERSPAAIRPRLLRARLRMVLRRPPLPEDLEAVFAADPRSPEGIAIKASMTEREGDPAKAAELTAEAIRLLSGEHPARVYDAADPARFKATLEDYLVSLERGAKVTVPADLDLAAARRRRDELEQRLREELERRNELERAAEEEEDEERAPAPRPLTEEELRSVGRNDPCPCGSGQKFKRCHGRGR